MAGRVTSPGEGALCQARELVLWAMGASMEQGQPWAWEAHTPGTCFSAEVEFSAQMLVGGPR